MRKHLRETLYLLLEEHKGHVWVRLINYSLLLLITLNVVAVALESETDLFQHHQMFFINFERFSVAVFTLEYIVRLWVCVEHEGQRYREPIRGRLRYALTPMAMVDLLSILPFYMGYFVGVDNLLVLRSLRLVRVLKLTRYSHSMDLLLAVLKNQAEVLLSALFIICILIVLASTGIYLVEGEQQPEAFGSIPRALWWATVTLTTIGYGDVVPITNYGKLFSGVITITGVAVAALPAGILASGLTKELDRRRDLFKTEILKAMNDGRLNFNELRQLEQLRREIGTSRADARLIFEEIKHASKLQTNISCPHCNGPIKISHPPGHIRIQKIEREHEAS